MSDNLLERLQTLGRGLGRQFIIYNEAAEEITRLRAENEKLRTTLSQTELYVVIEEDRGLGPMVLAVFKSEVGAIDFAKKRSHVEVHNANLLD